jgi:glycosyltransferase involved in cell wall biosynthesis
MLAADGSLRARLGQAARETAARRFDATRLAGQFAAIYEAARAPAPVVRRARGEAPGLRR